MPMPTPAPPPDANQTRRGLVSTIAQTFAGNKTFAGVLAALAGLVVTGNITLNSGDLSVTDGDVNANNVAATGQLTGQSVHILSGGTLELGDGTIVNGAEDLGSTIDTSAFVGTSKGYAPTATTRALWRLDETIGTATAADEKGAYPLSTVTGTPTVTDGRFGRARVLTGTQALSGAADAASVTKVKAGGWTWGGWVYPTGKSGSTFDTLIALADSGGTSVLQITYRNVDSCIYVGSTSAGNTTTSGCTPVPLNQWTHVAWTCSAGASMTCWQYVNAVSSGTSVGVSASTGTPTSPRWYAGGGLAGGSFGSYRGRLDEVFFEDRVLSAADVSAVYALGNVTLAGPLAFNDGTTQATAWTGVASNYLPLAGGTLAGQLVLPATGLKFSDNTTLTSAPTGSTYEKVYSTQVTLPAAGGLVMLGRFTTTAGAGNLMVRITGGNGGNSVAKQYALSFQYGTFGWFKALPMSTSGAFSGSDWDLEVAHGSNAPENMDLRVRNVSGSGTLQVTMLYQGPDANPFSTTTLNSGATGAGWYNRTPAVAFLDGTVQTTAGLPLSGGTLTGPLSGTSLTMSGLGNFPSGTTTNYYYDGTGNSRLEFSAPTNLYTSQVTDGATAIGHTFNTRFGLVNAGAKLASFQMAGAEKASVGFDGSVKTAGSLQFSGAGASKPTCAAAERGKLWFTQGATGVADTIEVCRKNASDAYVWTAF